MYGLQFHPEVTHTKGPADTRPFRARNMRLRKTVDLRQLIEDAITTIRRQVSGGQVLLGLSGGVDSSVVAALLHKAIGNQLTCVFVDNGLLRLKEGDQVMETFARHMGVKVIRADAESLFLSKLSGVHDPETKRKIIGNTFIEVFDAEARKLGTVNWLAQGTIYPDVIESAAANHGNALSSNLITMSEVYPNI